MYHYGILWVDNSISVSQKEVETWCLSLLHFFDKYLIRGQEKVNKMNKYHKTRNQPLNDLVQDKS